MGTFERSNLRDSRNDRHAAGTVAYPEGFGQKMRQLRRKRGLTQRMLAEILGVSTPAVCRWESGLAFPRRANVQAFASAFDLSESDLLSIVGVTADVAVDSPRAEKALERRASDDFHDRQETLLE